MGGEHKRASERRLDHLRALRSEHSMERRSATDDPAAPAAPTADVVETTVAPPPVTQSAQTPVAPAQSSAPPRSPVIVRVTNTSTIATPPLARTAAAAAPAAQAPRRMTRSEFCEGRTGPQPGYRSSVTGQIIDCGGAPVARAAADPARAALASPGTPGVRRATRSEICAEMAATGARFMNIATGLPVRCPTTELTRPTFNPATAPISQIAGTSAACAGENFGDPTRCGNQVQLPIYGETVAAVSRTSTKTLANLFSPQVPASNPTYVREATPTPPSGYERVWGDGRLNPSRGIVNPAPEPMMHRSQATPRQPQQQNRQSAVAPSHPYVQVGTFTSRDQAQGLAQGLRSRGLPMRIAVYERGGQEHRIVLAGPFRSQSALDRALSRVRAMGYASARPASY